MKGRATKSVKPRRGWARGLSISCSDFVRLAREAGALDAKIIAPDTVVTAAWVRLKCQFGCGGYGSTLMCPPHSPTPDVTRKALDSYRKAILIRGDDHVDVNEIAVKLEREAFLAGYYKALSFGSGPCGLCRDCPLDDCRHADRARPSMEASGIDVFATVRNNGFPIEVLTDYSCKENYYGLLLLE